MSVKSHTKFNLKRNEWANNSFFYSEGVINIVALKARDRSLYIYIHTYIDNMQAFQQSGTFNLPYIQYDINITFPKHLTSFESMVNIKSAHQGEFMITFM